MEHPSLTPCVTVFTLLSVTLVFTGTIISWFPQWHSFRFFNITSRESWDSYEFQIIETDWILYIHIATFSLQILWVCCSLFTILWQSKQVKKNPQLVVHPPIIPTAALIAFSVGLYGEFGWIIIRSVKDISTYSIISISASAVFISISTLLILREGCKTSKQPHVPGYVLAVRGFVYDGVLAMGAWSHALAMYTLAYLLQLYHIVERNIAEYITVGLIMAYLALWWSIDMYLTCQVTRRVISPYLLSTALFAMSLIKNLHTENLHFIVSATFLSMSVVLLLLKITAVCYRGCRNPSANEKYTFNRDIDNAFPQTNGGLLKDSTSNSKYPSMEAKKSKSYTLTNTYPPCTKQSLAGELVEGKIVQNGKDSGSVFSIRNDFVVEGAEVDSVPQTRYVLRDLPRPCTLPTKLVAPQSTEHHNGRPSRRIPGHAVRPTTLPRLPSETLRSHVPVRQIQKVRL